MSTVTGAAMDSSSVSGKGYGLILAPTTARAGGAIGLAGACPRAGGAGRAPAAHVVLNEEGAELQKVVVEHADLQLGQPHRLGLLGHLVDRAHQLDDWLEALVIHRPASI